MGRINNLRSDLLVGERRRVRRLESASPSNHTSVSRGAFRVLSPEGLHVAGSERITGEWYLDGDGYVDGDLVVNDGSITVPGANPIKIWQAPGGAVIEMGPGLLHADGNDISIGGSAGSEAFIVLNAATASVKLVTSSAAIAVDANGITLQGLPTIGRTSVTPNLPVGALWANPSGRIFRAV